MDRPVPPFVNRFGMRRRIVVFLSTGDTCRSPMAASYFRKLLIDAKALDIEVRSAGVYTVTGLRASQEAVQIMQNESVDLSRHRSSVLTPEMVRKADLILGMTPLHVQEALRLDKDARDKCYLLKEYSRSGMDKSQIDDPMGATLEVFKKCFREIREAVESLMETSFVGVKKKSKPAEPVHTEKKPKPAAKAKSAPKAAKAKPAAKSNSAAKVKSAKKAAAKPTAKKTSAKKASSKKKK